MDKYPDNPIALVEAPKTAIITTIYFGSPNEKKNLLWLAVYNLSTSNYEKCKVLKGRKVILFPDLSKDGLCFKRWSTKAQQIQERNPDISIQVSNLLENFASYSSKLEGADLADFLIERYWKDFRSITN